MDKRYGRQHTKEQQRKRELQRAKQKKEENIIVIICSLFLTICILVIWSILNNIWGAIVPVKAKVNVISVDTYKFFPEEYEEYMELPFMKEPYLIRYKEYDVNNEDLDVIDIVTHVNMGIDVPFFTREAITVTNTDDPLLVINKVFKLPDNYEPSDLVIVDDYRNQTMRAEAAQAFNDMQVECEVQGFDILAYSGYRNTELQEVIYNNMIDVYGVEYTNQYVSKPGHSEHTTGLAVDVSINGGDYNRLHESEHYDKFSNVLSDFGFIIRYPEGKEHLTGYSYESWHIRYVGVEVAKEIESSGLTLDEYVARLY